MQQVHDPFVNDDQHGMILDPTGLTLFPSLSSTCPAGRTWRRKRESGRDFNGKGSKYAGMLGTRAGRGRKVRAEWGRMGQNACQDIAYLD